jgi:HlyD family secretion protein
VAPVRGYVAQRMVQVGQQVAPGTALLAIVPEDQMWVEANFKETQLGSVRIGQSATVHSDFYKGAVIYRGQVVGILSGTGDVFQLLPPQKPLYQNDVYAEQGRQADALIDKIIQKNGGHQSPNRARDSLSQVPDHGGPQQ